VPTKMQVIVTAVLKGTRSAQNPSEHFVSPRQGESSCLSDRFRSEGKTFERKTWTVLRAEMLHRRV
jgi:hypothetical protein